eukprot:SAG11_NODE_30157_length_303_cov_1.333333_1_plen_101_part_11
MKKQYFEGKNRPMLSKYIMALTTIGFVLFVGSLFRMHIACCGRSQVHLGFSSAPMRTDGIVWVCVQLRIDAIYGDSDCIDETAACVPALELDQVWGQWGPS